ncbi:MAG: NAD(P)-dependent alcohol dehydrogenase [Solirubrobacterales bacterium]|nr:NAD(P)-dependent alcohol dehydrogenase [Solirubrobacterales bacterium]
MRAVVQRAYGAPDVLELRDVEVPPARDGEVLVRVRAAGLNIGDWHLLRGIPYVMRIVFGLRRPRKRIPGMDLAGEVEAIGAGVTGLRPGDAVFGWGRGVFAEYASVPAANVMATPSGLSFEEAAAVGDSAFTALIAVRDQGRVAPGDAVLINGASGGVGTFAVQLAKTFGAEVTAVCSTGTADLVTSLGADHVIDYTREDFTRNGRQYDVMLDLIGSHSLAASRRALTPRGAYVLVGVKDMGRWFGMARQFKALCTAPFVRQKMRVFVCKHTRADLTVLKELVEAGDVRPVIDQRYDLAQVREAFAGLGRGHARGNTVITV